MRFALLLTAAGNSARFGTKKEFETIIVHNETTTVLAAGLQTFLKTGLFSVAVITCAKGSENEAKKAVEPVLHNAHIPVFFTVGGKTRQESVYNGLIFLQAQKKYDFEAVMIHDGARPWVSRKIIIETAQKTEKYGAAVPALCAVDTQKIVDKNGKITQHLPRESIFAVQTPQSFLFEPLLNAHKKAQFDGRIYTDDTEIWAQYTGDVYITEGERKNKKITFTEDLA